MLTAKQKVGNLGEKIAAKYLENKGYLILERNFQTKIGELDIVAFQPNKEILFRIRKGIGKYLYGAKENDLKLLIKTEILKRNGLLVFIEVKSGKIDVSRETFVRPEEHIDYWKRRHLIKTAQNYLAYRGLPLDINWQIDVIAVEMNKDSHKANLRHIKKAITI